MPFRNAPPPLRKIFRPRGPSAKKSRAARLPGYGATLSCCARRPRLASQEVHLPAAVLLQRAICKLSKTRWPVGLMDKASASGAGDSRFESWAGQFSSPVTCACSCRQGIPGRGMLFPMTAHGFHAPRNNPPRICMSRKQMLRTRPKFAWAAGACQVMRAVPNTVHISHAFN